MKLNHEKAGARLQHIDPQNRVFIYNAQIMLEFLRETFVNPRVFMKELSSYELVKTESFEVKRENLKDPEDFRNKAMLRAELYEMYVRWRYNKPYTTPLEKPWKFGVILKKMTFERNGWQFGSLRIGTSQSVYITPLMKRSDAEMEQLAASPLIEKPKDEIVEAVQEDLSSEE